MGLYRSREPGRILKWTLAKFGSLLWWMVLSPPTWQNWGEKEKKRKNLGLILPRPWCILYIKDICKVAGRPGTESPCLPDSRVINPNPRPKKNKGSQEGKRRGDCSPYIVTVVCLCVYDNWYRCPGMRHT
jgi:hypothetical protein